MKRYLLLPFLILLIGTSASFAQTANDIVTIINCGKDSFEPNNNMATAHQLPVQGTIRNSRICPAWDEDWYSYKTTTARPNLRITLRDVPANYNVSLHDASGNLLVSSANAGIMAEALTYNTATAATYYIRVFGATGTDWNAGQAYRLRPATSSSAFSRLLSTDIEDQMTLVNFLVYPNPTADQFTVELLSQKNGNATLKLVDLQGRVLKETNQFLSSGTEYVSIDVSDLAAGMYMLECTHENFTFTRKVQITK